MNRMKTLTVFTLSFVLIFALALILNTQGVSALTSNESWATTPWDSPINRERRPIMAIPRARCLTAILRARCLTATPRDRWRREICWVFIFRISSLFCRLSPSPAIAR